MAAKKKHKKAPVHQRKSLEGLRAFNTRQPELIIQWLDETANANHMSRDQFVRLLFSTAREQYLLVNKPGTEEADLFERARQDLRADTERILREVISERLPAVATRKMIRGER